MWDSKEIAERALQRAGIIRKQRRARKRKIYAMLLMTACLVVIVGFAFVIPLALTDVPGAVDSRIYGAAWAVGGTFGSYVLLAVVSFALGCAVTIFCYKVLLKKRPGETNENDGDDSSH